jgi:hypothetical protein
MTKTEQQLRRQRFQVYPLVDVSGQERPRFWLCKQTFHRLGDRKGEHYALQLCCRL